MKFFKKLRDNDKAELNITRVICYFILIVVLFFGVDLCILLTQTVVTSYQTAFYSEKISVQGGLLGDRYILPGPINSLTRCASCYTNADISRTFGQTMSKFGLTPYDWKIGLIDKNENFIWIHNNGVNVDPVRQVRLPYMSLNELYVSTDFIPKVSGFLWHGTRIQKQITFVSEYIER